MEPGEYLTNVLSLNDFASINYEYLETQLTTPTIPRKQLQKLEAEWMQEGKLVYYDPSRDRVWIFHRNLSASRKSFQHSDPTSIAKLQGLGHLRRETGTYEPASLARNKSIMNSTSASNSGSSASSAVESSLRNAQAVNARATQANGSLNTGHESSAASPGTKLGVAVDGASLKQIHECFISAVLGSILYYLCRNHEFIPLNSRTLIATNRELATDNTQHGLSNAIELATLDISLTSLGTLVIKAHSEQARGLQSITRSAKTAGLSEQLDPGTALWLAPTGNAAKFYCVVDSKNADTLGLPQSQGNHVLDDCAIAAIKSWQSKCLEWLSDRYMNPAALKAGEWFFVQPVGGFSPYSDVELQKVPILEELAIIPWPAMLCFQTCSGNSQDAKRPNFSMASSRDPLSFAEEWFASKDERVSVIARRQRERQLSETVSKERAEIETRTTRSHIPSPMVLRRGSISGSMYPTPPDAPHPAVGATPSFDGNASTPGNQAGFPPAEPATNTSINVNGTNDAELWSSLEKKEQNSSVINFNESYADADNPFGDLGGDMFAADITDADFNFFDEPDMDVSLDSPAPEACSVSKEITTLEDTRMIDDAYSCMGYISQTLVADQDQKGRQDGRYDCFTSQETKSQNKIGKIMQDVLTPAPRLPTSNLPENIPFNEETVFSKLNVELLQRRASEKPRRSSVFETVSFSDSLLSVNEKYGASGRFKVPARIIGSKIKAYIGLPKTEYLSKKIRTHNAETESAHLVRLSLPSENLESGSQISEKDDTSSRAVEVSNMTSPGLKRKWDIDETENIASSFDAVAVEYENLPSTPQSITGSHVPRWDPDPGDWPLTSYFAFPDPDGCSNTLSDPELVATAQLITDQAVFGTLQLPGIDGCNIHQNQNKSASTKRLMHSITAAAKMIFGDFSTCTMRSYLDIQGIPASNQVLGLPPRPIVNPRGTQGLDGRLSNLFSIAPPQLEVRRSDSCLSVLPVAVNFWENLGLGPSRGPKDIECLCMYPEFDGVAANASIHLDQMRSVYESSRLGSHDRIISKEINNGLVPFTIETSPTKNLYNLTLIKETAGQLGRSLSSLSLEKKNLVVYLVYPDEDSTLLVHLCSAFLYLFKIYKKALSERRLFPVNELVLQLIPLSFIALPSSLAVPSPSEYFRLALEVFDRCVSFPSWSSPPAIILESPLPKSIDFKLNPNPSASLLHENTCLHIAYAQSIDERWITAAWTDNGGTQQMTASYCLGRKNEPICTPFSEIAHEIWETTLEFISHKKIHWRILIARVGVMNSSEIEFWTGLASTESNAQVSLTLITIQTDPFLKLLSPPISLSSNGTVSQSVITPVSTPQSSQPSVISPDNVATPARDNQSTAIPMDASTEPDIDARLIDLTDQSWGAVLSHRLNNSNSLVDLNPALVSGYLIKSCGANPDDSPVVMEVNIVHSEVVGNPRTFHECLLKEVLGYYRGLGTLARVRGIVDSVSDVRPWHVAAVEKAIRAMYMLM